MHRKKMLFIDDNADLCLVNAMVFEKKGFDVVIASDMDSIERSIDNEAFDVVVLDYQLMGETSESIAIKIRTMNPDAKLIMISGILTPERSGIQRLIERGVVDAFVEKPMDHRMILGIVEADNKR